MKNLSEILGGWFNNKPVEDNTLFSPPPEVSEDELEQAYIDSIDSQGLLLAKPCVPGRTSSDYTQFGKDGCD